MIQQVPDSDIFQVCGINEIYDENCDNRLEHGCFIAFIRRKEMMQFDSLFMIKVAESKGLFGDPNKQPQKKEEIVPIIRQSSAASRKSFKRAKVKKKLRTNYFFSILYSQISIIVNKNINLFIIWKLFCYP